MNERPQNKARRNGGDWFSVLVGVAIPLVATMADLHITLWVTFGTLVVMAGYYWRRGQFKSLIIFPAIGAVVVLGALVVFWLKGRH